MSALAGAAHYRTWGLPDPVKATGTDVEQALIFAQTYSALRRRIAAFIEPPFASLNWMSLQALIDRIGLHRPMKEMHP
jgi:hypothetical protein